MHACSYEIQATKKILFDHFNSEKKLHKEKEKPTENHGFEN
jgi:hypothetical protein